MKIHAILVALFFTGTVLSQSKDSIISEAISGHIYKPKKIEANDTLIKRLKKPEGFDVKKFAGDLGKPRMMALGPRGEIYVTSREDGYVRMLKDGDGDGVAEINQKLLSKKNAHGITVKGNTLYLMTVKELYKAKIKEDGTLGELKELLNDFPDGGQHNNRTISFGPDDLLYISVGSTCNACEETSEESATIIRMDSTGNGRTIFAKGLRNTIGYDWEPTSGVLYGLDHGIDWLGDDLQKEELNLIVENGNYGWPYIYDKSKFNKADQPPHGTYSEYAAKCKEPVMQLQAHSAPLNFKFYKGRMFPSDYKNSALVTLHGSWNRKAPVGYKLVWIRFAEGKPKKVEDFVSGFLTDNNKSVFGRPVGLLELKDGSVLVSDDLNGNIYRISYTQ